MLKLFVKLVVRLLVVAALFLSSLSAIADEISSPYSFSGPCSSQGSWTRAALSHTNQIKQVIVKLKDNPACSSLQQSLETTLSGMEQQLQEVQSIENQTKGKANNLLSLPGEIGALRTFSKENSLFRNNVIDLLMGKTVTLSALSTQRMSSGGNIPGEQMAESLQSLGNRAYIASAQGLKMFNSTIVTMQQAKAGCLDDTTGSSAMAGLVNVLSAFAGSGNSSLNLELARTVQNLGQYLGRNKKYVDALRQINDREFITSMSCLMEITSDGYCSSLDALHLFNEVTSSQHVKIGHIKNEFTGKFEKKIVGLNENFAKKLEKGPLAGYYIISRQVPIVTDWIQKVQYGITPQLPQEADFQIEISTNVYEHYNTMKRIEGKFNFQKRLMGEVKDFRTKQTYVLEMLNYVATFMTDSKGMNFFTQVKTGNEIYFGLINEPIPEAVLGRGPQGMQWANDPGGWLKANYRDMAIFADPDKLAETIAERMKEQFDEATRLAIQYYNKYFIVDKVQVVNDSLLGLDANVRDALVNIDNYLENLENRIAKDSKDPTIYGFISDTRGRIGRILARYKDLRDYSLQLVKEAESDPQHKNLDPVDLEKKLRKVGDALLQQVYKEFLVLTARTGFLSNRMASLVFQDYTLSLRKRNHFDQYFEDLMLATGYNTLNLMMNMSQREYSKIKTDLDSATNIYKKDIDILEPIVESTFVRNIFDLYLMSKNVELSEAERLELVYEMSNEMGRAKIPGEDPNAFQRWLGMIFTRLSMDLAANDREYLGAPSFTEKLVMPFSQLGNKILGRRGRIVVSPVSEFQTAAGEMAKLCTQALSFPNLRYYWELCSKSVLYSPLMKENIENKDLKELMETYLSVNFVRKAYEHLDPAQPRSGLALARNYQAKICALRDYHRRNEIARITSAMREDGDSYYNAFTKIVDEDGPTDAAPGVPKEIVPQQEPPARESQREPPQENPKPGRPKSSKPRSDPSK